MYENQALIDCVIEQMIDDLMCEDFTAIEEMLSHLDSEILNSYLSEVNSYIQGE